MGQPPGGAWGGDEVLGQTSGWLLLFAGVGPTQSFSLRTGVERISAQNKALGPKLPLHAWSCNRLRRWSSAQDLAPRVGSVEGFA